MSVKENKIKSDNYEIYNKIWSNTEKEQSEYINISGGCRWLNARIGDIIKRNDLGQKVSNIIDVGSGDGSRICHAMQYFPNASLKGYDFTESAVKLANKRYGSDRIKFYCSDVTKDDMEGTPDLVTAFGILEHIEDWEGFIKDLTILGGGLGPKYILIYTNTGKMHKNEVYVGHVRNFKKGEIEQYFRKIGWNVADVSYGGFPLYDLIFKRIQYHNAEKYLETISRKLNKRDKILHNILFFLLRFCCLQNKKGAELIALFYNPAYREEGNS